MKIDGESSLMNQANENDVHKTALYFAFYNALLFTVLGISLASIFAVYQMLYMFLMPILWASLIGTVVFPLKRLISTNLRNWLDDLDEMDRPLLVGIILLPVQIILQTSNYIYETALSFAGLFIVIAFSALKLLSQYDAFNTLLNLINRLYIAIDLLIDLFTYKWVLILILLYGVGFSTWVYMQELNHINKKFARFLSVPIWITALASLANYFGLLRVIIFSSSCVLLALISIGILDAKDPIDENNQQIGDSSKAQTVENPSFHEEDNTKSNAAPAIPPINDNRLDKALSSDAHLQIISGLCALLWVVKHNSMLFLIFILFIPEFLIKIGARLGLNEYVTDILLSAKKTIVERSNKFVHVIVAGPLRKFLYLLFTSDRMFISGLLARVDLISSVCVMLLLAFGSTFVFLFTIFQLHSETVHMVRLGSNVISSNPDWLCYALNYTEGHIGEHDLDNYMEQAYQQGRTWLALNIRSLADAKDPSRADQLEEQAKLLVDNLYNLWEQRGKQIFNETLAEDYALQKQISDGDTEANDMLIEKNNKKQHWFSRLVKNANLALWKSELTTMISDNLEMVIMIARSVWHVLLVNISLLTTILVAVLSLLLSFGSELLNFIIECIVFLTTVYYLLASSSEQWLPLHWVNDFSNSLQLHRLINDSARRSLDIAKAVEIAISGVFVLSTKMAIFYGLYTYFVHSLFAMNIVFLPSMLAAIFAAIPIFPSYSVALFGIVECWLVRGDPIAAAVFTCASVAPIFFADPAFYRELKGSHPYITGLAVVGGIYWLGLQGAIIGPIILCLMVALLNLYAQFANHGISTN